VEDRVSYRVLAKRYREMVGVKVSPSSLQRMVMRVAERCKTPAEMSRELGLNWRGYLIADDKRVPVRGKAVSWYAGVDKTGDIVHAEMMVHPTVSGMAEFFETVRDDLQYRMRGLTTDQEILFHLAYRRVYPGKPHQICLKHAVESLDRQLGYTRQLTKRAHLQRKMQALMRSLPDRSMLGTQHTWEEIKRGYDELRRMRLELRPVEILRKRIHRVLFSRSYTLARARWAAFARHPLHRHRAHQIIVEFIRRHWHRLTVHYHYAGMPNTNNIAENTMRQIERRLKTIEAFGSVRSASKYLHLLIAYLRTKPFTDCRGHNRYRNGPSRLELAGASLPTSDWLKLALKPHN